MRWNLPKHEIHDSCGLIAGLSLKRRSLYEICKKVNKIKHRGGDGFGVLFKIEKEVIKKESSQASYVKKLNLPGFDLKTPLLLMIQMPIYLDMKLIIDGIETVLKRFDIELHYAKKVSSPTNDAVQVVHWRFCGYDLSLNPEDLDLRLCQIRQALNQFQKAGNHPQSFQTISISKNWMVLYKIIGDFDDFIYSFGEENLKDLHTSLFLSHVRYSTNTLPLHRSAQPFDLLAHNGEINNIGSIRKAMRSHEIPLSPSLSDSADLNGLIRHITSHYGFDLQEALYLVFPKQWFPVSKDTKDFHDSFQEYPEVPYRLYLKRCFRPFRAEGPAAVIATDGNRIIGRLDNMGLRPLYLVETKSQNVYIVSELGAVGKIEQFKLVHQIRAGEIISASSNGKRIEISYDADIENGIIKKITLPNSIVFQSGYFYSSRFAAKAPFDEKKLEGIAFNELYSEEPEKNLGINQENYLLVNGFSSRVKAQLGHLFGKGTEKGSGTGWRNGLAVNWKNIFRFSEIFKAMTAQVTAPTISAEHEKTAMDQSLIMGFQYAPLLSSNHLKQKIAVQLSMPMIIGFEGLTELGQDFFYHIAKKLQIITLKELDQLVSQKLFELKRIDYTLVINQHKTKDHQGVSLKLALDLIVKKAASIAGKNEYSLLLFHDEKAFKEEGRVAIPPEMIVGAVDHYLTEKHLRHKVQIIVQSREINCPHTFFVLLQLGADILIPTLLSKEALNFALSHDGDHPAETLLRGFMAIKESLAIMYGRIATNHLAAGRGGRRITPIGLDGAVSRKMGLLHGMGEGIGFPRIQSDLSTKARYVFDQKLKLSDPVQREIDSMPLNIALAEYLLLGGIQRIGKNKYSKSKGQVKIALQTLWDCLKNRPVEHKNLHRALSDLQSLPVEQEALIERIVDEILKLDLEQTESLISLLYETYDNSPVNFLDSLLLRKTKSDQTRNYQQVGTSLDKRQINQIIGAISYGANSYRVHELYARVMAQLGGQSNGGEGGVPESIRSLYITSRLLRQKAGIDEITRQLRQEIPDYFKGHSEKEIKTMVEKLINNTPADFQQSRFEQISTGRFGVDAYAFLDCEKIEIKISQGAKPGVGGSLPGNKVLENIALTRGVNIGQTLNSPTVHHDIYSIEDLRQLITSAKTLNPKIKVSVKLAAMSDLDIVSVGVVKAGADYIWVDGFEGGTGSAKDTHKEHCGLPTAPIINQIHKSLINHGIRGYYRHKKNSEAVSRSYDHHLPDELKNQFEWFGPRIIAAGGVRYPDDGIKLILAGAEYIGYGDAAQVAVGCIRCQKCPSGDCPSFITTNKQERLIRFRSDINGESLRRFVLMFDIGLRKRAVQLMPDIKHIEELTGRSDLLVQNENALLRVDSDFFIPTTFEASSRKAPIDSFKDTKAVIARPVNKTIEAQFQKWEQKILRALTRKGEPENSPAGSFQSQTGLKLSRELSSKRIEITASNEDRLIGLNIIRDFIRLRNHVWMMTKQNILLKIVVKGAVGSGFGMFGVAGIELTLVGMGGDYLAGSVNGAKIFVLPAIDRHQLPVLGTGGAGNAVAYSMRKGELHLCNLPGTRFAIRFSGGSVFIWGSPQDVLRSFENQEVKSQFFAEYMTKGSIVCCSDPGYNLLRATTGQETELILRKPDNLTKKQYIHSIHRRIPDSFEIQSIGEKHENLIKKGHEDYLKKAREHQIDFAVSPIRKNENLYDSFILIREKKLSLPNSK